MQPNNKIFVDKARFLKRVIIISWVSLLLCFVIKIFGGNYFEIMSNSKGYKALCDYADSHFWLKYLIGVCSSMLCQSLYLLAILQKYKFNRFELSLTFISVALSTGIRYFTDKYSIAFDILLCFILPIVFLGKDYKRYYHVIIAWVLTFLFQLVSLLVKNVGVVVIDESTFISLIYGIDVYIMCFLYYLYTNFKKENEKMGMFWVMFMGKPADRLRAMKAKREAKIKKLEAEVNAIEIELSKKKAEK